MRRTAPRSLVEDLETAFGEVDGRGDELRHGVEDDLVLHVEALCLGLILAEDDVVVVCACLGCCGDGWFGRHGIRG